MKILKLFWIFVFFGCTFTDNEEEVNVVQENYFTLNLNGTALNINPKTAYLDDDLITIYGVRVYNLPRQILTFDLEGRLGKFAFPIYSTNGTDFFESYNNYNSHFFNFNLISYDSIKKRVKGEYSGYIYTNPEDFNSESKYVSGNFDLPVVGIIAPVSGKKNKALLNNNEWVSSNYFMIRDQANQDYHDITLHTLRNDDYKIMISFNRQYTTIGSYLFNSSSIINRVRIAKFNLQTNTYTYYNCTGNLNVNSRTNDIIAGTYSLVAINPNDSSDVINVTNGDFQLSFIPY